MAHQHDRDPPEGEGQGDAIGAESEVDLDGEDARASACSGRNGATIGASLGTGGSALGLMVSSPHEENAPTAIAR